MKRTIVSLTFALFSTVVGCGEPVQPEAPATGTLDPTVQEQECGPATALAVDTVAPSRLMREVDQRTRHFLFERRSNVSAVAGCAMSLARDRADQRGRFRRPESPSTFPMELATVETVTTSFCVVDKSIWKIARSEPNGDNQILELERIDQESDFTMKLIAPRERRLRDIIRYIPLKPVRCASESQP